MLCKKAQFPFEIRRSERYFHDATSVGELCRLAGLDRSDPRVYIDEGEPFAPPRWFHELRLRDDEGPPLPEEACAVIRALGAEPVTTSGLLAYRRLVRLGRFYPRFVALASPIMLGERIVGYPCLDVDGYVWTLDVTRLAQGITASHTLLVASFEPIVAPG